MAFNITIDNWINEVGSSPAGGKVVVHYTVYGPGLWEYILRYTVFAEFGQNQWIQMLPDLSDPRHTRTPFRTTNRTSAVFVWNAGRQGIPILTEDQEHLFAIGLKDISCVGSIGKEPGGRTFPPWIPGPPRVGPPVTQPPVNPPGRNPGNNPFPVPRVPPGPGRQPRGPVTQVSGATPSNPITPRGPVIEYTPGVPGTPTTPPSRGRPTTRTSSTPTASLPNNGGITRGPITGTGVYKDPTQGPILRNNPIDTSLIQDGSDPGFPGTRITSQGGTVYLPYGGRFGEATGDQSDNIISVSSRWETPSSLETLREYASSNNNGNNFIESSEQLDNALSSGTSQRTPFVLEKGDPNPYIQTTNSLQDSGGIEESAQFNNDFSKVPVLRTENLSKLSPRPSFNKDEFSRDWIDLNVFAEPSFVSIGYPLTITASSKNKHESIPLESSLLLCLKAPDNEWYQISQTTLDVILSDHASSIGLTFNTNSFTETGVWKACCIAYDKNGKVCDFDFQNFEIYSSHTQEGADKSLLNDYSKLEDFVVPVADNLQVNSKSPDLVLRGIHKKTLANNRVSGSVDIHSVHFEKSNQKYAVIDCNGSFSAAIHNTDLYDFICKLYGPNTISSPTHAKTGPLYKLDSVEKFILQDDYLLKVPDPGQDYCLGGIDYISSLSAGEYYLAMTPKKSPTVANVIIGGNSSIKKPIVDSYTRSGNTWTLNLSLPFGLERYRIGYIGKNKSKIDLDVSWTTFKSLPNGKASVNVDGSIGGYISVLRLGPDNTFNITRDKILTYNLQ